MLNEYFELMVETIFKYEGTLDKFMGDGIMALWGAPVVHPTTPCAACSARSSRWRCSASSTAAASSDEQPPLAIGIGIHTGPLVAGYVGSSKALSYTVIGDTANTSARLCGIAQPGRSSSARPPRPARHAFRVEELPPAHVKGKEKALRIFNVIRERPQFAVPRAIGG